MGQGWNRSKKEHEKRAISANSNSTAQKKQYKVLKFEYDFEFQAEKSYFGYQKCAVKPVKEQIT
jgi:hypothetical protein